MSSRKATSHEESPLFFSAGDETLFGILTRPTSEPVGVGVILVYGGAYNTSANVNQMWLHTARAIAGEGLHVLRYDYHGIGDSTGKAGIFDHRSPYAEDLLGAMQVMKQVGVERLLVVGDCLGARASLVCAAESEDIEALLMLVPMVRDATKGKDEEWASQYGIGHYLRRAIQPSTWKRLTDPVVRRSYRRVAKAKLEHLLSRVNQKPTDAGESPERADSWVSDMFLDLFKTAISKGISIDILFGSKDTERRGDFDAASRGRLGTIVEEAGSQVTMVTVDGSVAGITDLGAQTAIIEYATSWATSRSGGP